MCLLLQKYFLQFEVDFGASIMHQKYIKANIRHFILTHKNRTGQFERLFRLLEVRYAACTSKSFSYGLISIRTKNVYNVRTEIR